jgi:tellurite resistance protein
LEERREHHLHNFYQEIIKKFENIGNIFIFGPGEAKSELAKEIEKLKDQHAEIAAVETCDKLTENQIIAKVKSFFKA